MRAVGQSAKKASGFMEEFGKSAAASVRRYAGFTVFASSFYALTKAIKGSIDEAIDFQRELVRIRQVSGVSLKDLKGLTDEITHLATSFGVSSKKILNSAQVLAQAGFSIKEINKAATTLAKIELAPTFENITDATEGMIAIMGQFGTTADDFEKQFGAINAVSAKFAVESSDIITAVRRTGGAFAAAGGELNDLIALFTSVRQTSRESAETIATGFRTIFTRIQRPRTVDFLEKLGINLRDDTTKQFVGPYEAVKKLSAALNAIPSTDVRFAQITEELGGFRQIGKVIPLIKQFNVAEQAKIVALRAEGSLTADAAKAQDAFSIKLTKVREEFQAFIRTVSDNSVFKVMLDQTLQLGSALAKLAGSLEKILPLLVAAGAAKLGQAAIPFGKGFLPGVGLQGGKSAALGGLAAGSVILPSILDSFGLLNEETKKLTSNLQNFGGTFLGLNVAMHALTDNLQQGGRDKLADLRPQSSTLKNQVLGGDAISKDLYNQFSNKVRDNKLLDVEINSRKKQLLGNAAIVNSPTTSVAAKNKAQAALVIDTLHLKNLGRDRRAGGLEENDLKSRTIEEKNLVRIRSKELTAVNKEIAALEKAERNLNNFTLGLSFASAGMISLGNYIEKNATAQLKSGGRYAKNDFATGRATSTAGFSAAGGGLVAAQVASYIPDPRIKAAVLVLGTVISAAVGAAQGFSSGLKEATDILDKADFDKSFGKFDTFLKSISGGKTNALGGVGQFRSGVGLLSDRLSNASLGDKESAQGAIQSSIVGLQQFLNEIAKTVNSFAELETIVGRDVIEKFALFTDLPFSKVKEEFEKQIKSQKDLIRQNNILSAAQENQIRQVSLYQKLTGVLQDSIDSLSDFSGVLDATKIKDLSSVLARPETIVDKSLLTKAIGQATSSLGPEGQKFGEEFSKAAEVLNKLPEIFIQATSKPFSESKGLNDEFADALKANFPDISDTLFTALKANIAKFQGPEGKDQNTLAEAQKNPANFIKQAGEGILEASQEVAVELHKLVTEQLNSLAGLYDKRRQVEEKYISGINSLIGIREQKANFGFEARGERVPLSVGAGFEKDRLNAVRGGTPLTAAATATATQSRILELNQLLQDETGDRRSLLEELEAEKNALSDSVRVLEFFADATSRNAHLQKELELEQKRSNSKFDFAKAFTFGDLDSRRDLARGALGGGVLARTGDISKVPGDLRGGALSFLEGFDETPLAFLKGKSGRGVIRDTIEKNLVSSGLKPDEAKAIAKNKTTPAEEKLIEAINKNFDVAATAQKTLTDLIGNQQLAVLKDIKNNTEKFSILLEKNFVTKEKNEKNAEATALSGKISGLLNQGDAFGEIKSIIGNDPNKFNNIRSSLPQLKALVGQRDDVLGRSRDFNKFKSSLGNLTLDNGHEIFQQIAGETAPFASSTFGKDRLDRFKKQFSGIHGSELGSKVFNTDFESQFDTNNGTFGQFSKVFKDRIESVGKGINKDKEGLNDQITKLSQQTGIQSLTELFKAAENAPKLLELFQSIPEDATFEGLGSFMDEIRNTTTELFKVRQQVNNLEKKETSLNDSLKKAGGGFIPGYGSGDVVPAMLTPGEFVIRKDAAEAIGYDTLNDINRQGFAKGGRAERLEHIANRKAIRQSRKDAYKASKTARTSPRRLAEQNRLDLSRRKLFAKELSRPFGAKPLALKGAEAAAYFDAIKADALRQDGLFGGRGLHGDKAVAHFEKQRQNAYKTYTPATGGLFSNPAVGGHRTPVKPKFADGGAVSGGGGAGVSSQAIESLARFVDGISRLSSSLDSFPRSIEMNCRHTVEVIHNGAQVFESLNSSLVSLVEATVGREINRMIKNKFPEVGVHE